MLPLSITDRSKENKNGKKIRRVNIYASNMNACEGWAVTQSVFRPRNVSSGALPFLKVKRAIKKITVAGFGRHHHHSSGNQQAVLYHGPAVLGPYQTRHLPPGHLTQGQSSISSLPLNASKYFYYNFYQHFTAI